MKPLTYLDYIKWKSFFTYYNYEKLINVWKKEHNIITFSDVLDGKTGLILRHDVDFSVEMAYKLAELELKLGIKSTYFILVTAYSYNVLSSKLRSLIKNLSDSGFDIGLHFDPSIYSDENELNYYFNKEKEVLESIIGKSITSFALHNPSIHGQYIAFDNVLNAYDERFFNDDIYLSDSRIDFFGKDPFRFFSSKSNEFLQVVLHPEQWSFSGCDYMEIEKELLGQHKLELRRYALTTKMYEYCF